MNLLSLACSMDDGAAVDELLQQDAAEVERLLAAKGKNMSGKGKKNASLRRREPMGQKLTEFACDMTPLLAAMTFASRDVVEKLMDIGGDALVEKDGLALLGERPCLFRGAIVSGRCDNIKLLLERYPQYASALNPEFGTSALHMATGTTLRGKQTSRRITAES